MTEAAKPDCYKCVHRMDIAGNAHSRCNNFTATVTGRAHGIKMGWFHWPLNYDPVWLQACDGFSDQEGDRKPPRKADPLVELFALLR